LRPSFRDFLDGKEVQAVGWRIEQAQVICWDRGRPARLMSAQRENQLAASTTRRLMNFT
jgi:hypothetical protein